MIPRIIRDFDFEEPSGGVLEKNGLRTENYWFVKATNFEVLIKERK